MKQETLSRYAHPKTDLRLAEDTNIHKAYLYTGADAQIDIHIDWRQDIDTEQGTTIFLHQEIQMTFAQAYQLRSVLNDLMSAPIPEAGEVGWVVNDGKPVE